MSEDADYEVDDVGLEIEMEVDQAEWTICNVLLKTKKMTLGQWQQVAFAYSYFDDDPGLREQAPNLSSLSGGDMAYLVDELDRHQHSLSDTDYKKVLSKSQIQKMRRYGKSLK